VSTFFGQVRDKIARSHKGLVAARCTSSLVARSSGPACLKVVHTPGAPPPAPCRHCRGLHWNRKCSKAGAQRAPVCRTRRAVVSAQVCRGQPTTCPAHGALGALLITWHCRFCHLHPAARWTLACSGAMTSVELNPSNTSKCDDLVSTQAWLARPIVRLLTGLSPTLMCVLAGLFRPAHALFALTVNPPLCHCLYRQSHAHAVDPAA
jgi:hypothetical protein